jgi:hypothetical protein
LEKKQLRVGDFSFLVERDYSADPLSGVAVWVFFRREPCCDDNGHQYRFFLPLGVQERTIHDVCVAFTLATHCTASDIAA